jgi:hypothetical protein
MNSLLKLATETHGGVDHWNHLESLKAHLSVTGVLWHAKGRPDVLKDIRIELPLHEQRLTTHFVGQNKRCVFTPHQVSVEDEQGHIIERDREPYSPANLIFRAGRLVEATRVYGRCPRRGQRSELRP